MVKIALGVEYNGSKYHGWQYQEGLDTIQLYLEYALTKIANHNIKVICAGRTDVGVHAIGQVIHFETSALRKEVSWIKGTNYYLPKDIVIRWCKIVESTFHARFSAISRCYRYIIFNHIHRPVISATGLTHYNIPLDNIKMHIAAQYLVGEHDFTSFRSIKCCSKTPYRNIFFINVYRYNYYIIIDIKANSFVYHMVRNIVGNLYEIGRGHKNITWLKELLIIKNRKKAAAKAKASGLYLLSVDYPLKYKIPKKIIQSPIFI